MPLEVLFRAVAESKHGTVLVPAVVRSLMFRDVLMTLGCRIISVVERDAVQPRASEPFFSVKFSQLGVLDGSLLETPYSGDNPVEIQWFTFGRAFPIGTELFSCSYQSLSKSSVEAISLETFQPFFHLYGQGVLRGVVGPLKVQKYPQTFAEELFTFPVIS